MIANRRPASRPPRRRPRPGRAALRAALRAGLAGLAASPALVPVPALAAGHASTNPIGAVIGNLTAWLVGILAGLATLFLTIGGVRYLTAGGDPAGVEKAKVALRSAAIGYALAILAPVLVTILAGLVRT